MLCVGYNNELNQQQQISCSATLLPHLALGGVRRAQHAPLRRLQRARPADLAGFLKLGGDPGHHAQSGDVGESRQDLRDALAVHLEPFQRPVTLMAQNSRVKGQYINIRHGMFSCGSIR